MKALFSFNSYQNILELLWLASTSFSSPPQTPLPLHITPSAHCPLLHIAPVCASLCLDVALLAGRSGLKTAPLAHHLQGLVSSICFYCPLLGTVKEKADPLGSCLLPSVSLCNFRGAAEPQVGVPAPPRSSDPSSPLARPREATLARGTAHPLVDTAGPAHSQHIWPRGRA